MAHITYKELVVHYGEELADELLGIVEQSFGIQDSAPPLDKGKRLQRALVPVHKQDLAP